MTPEQVITELAGELPPATLVLGPGTWGLVSRVAGPEWLTGTDLTAPDVRQLRENVWLLPVRGVRVVALCLDKAAEQVQNMLLKVLEEPAPGTSFVLAAERRPLPTVVSRCRVLVAGQEVAGEAADPRDKAAVATVLRAARSGQATLLAQTMRGWLPVQAKLLSVWAAEAVSGQWSVFEPGTAPGVSAGQALALLTELARYPGAKTGALVALESVFSPG
jgi:DNA polymerase III delta subunit-like protein